MEPLRHLVDVPARPGRQGLCLIVKIKGAEIPPCGIVTGELDHTRLIHQSEHSPPLQPHGEPPGPDTGTPESDVPWCHEHSQKPCLKKKRMPLIAQKDLARHDDRQIEEP